MKHVLHLPYILWGAILYLYVFNTNVKFVSSW